MPERSAEQIREEIAAERQGLHQDVDELKSALRARVPFLIAGLAAASLLALGILIGIRKIRKHS
jgi:hypothetical protein